MSCKNVTWVTKSRTTLYSDWFQYCAGLWAGSGWSVPLSVCLTACKLVFITETRSWEPETVCHIVTLSPANIVISQSQGNINETRSRYSRHMSMCSVLPDTRPCSKFTFPITYQEFYLNHMGSQKTPLSNNGYISQGALFGALCIHTETFYQSCTGWCTCPYIHYYSWSWSGILIYKAAGLWVCECVGVI